MYKAVWTPFLGEELSVRAENNIQHDQYTISVLKEDDSVGHYFSSLCCTLNHFELEFDATCLSLVDDLLLIVDTL